MEEKVQNQNYSKGLKSISWKSRVVCACTADCLNCSLTKAQCYILSPHDTYSQNTAALPMAAGGRHMCDLYDTTSE